MMVRLRPFPTKIEQLWWWRSAFKEGWVYTQTPWKCSFQRDYAVFQQGNKRGEWWFHFLDC